MRSRVVLLTALLAAPAPARAGDRCRAGESAIVVRDHALSLCEAGREAKRFPVALGRGGVGKRAAGDNKTPLGTYPLGAPRPSAQYGTFIPVGYPLQMQRRAGYSGSGIGIHGPRRGQRWAGRMNAWVDWTRGCIAVPSDGEIAQIAAWVRRVRPQRVRLE